MDLIRSLFGHALKTNEHLFFAVLTGCLRVAKESIFTGLNNFKSKKENFYHGIPLGLLSHREDWLLFSSTASGQGYSDILIELPEEDLGIVIELKYSESPNLEAAYNEALAQIEEKDYAARLVDDGMTSILKYGVACRRNTCMVRMLSDEPNESKTEPGLHK